MWTDIYSIIKSFLARAGVRRRRSGIVFQESLVKNPHSLLTGIAPWAAGGARVGGSPGPSKI